MSSFKKSIINGTIWSIAGQVATLLIILISNVILARMLSPKEFGQIGIIMFFIMLANVFTEGGLAGALVRKKDATKTDYSTVFVFNLVVSLFCFILLLFFSNYIASYYHDLSLKKLLIVSGFVLIINAFQITQNAKLMSDMKFKQKTIYRFVSVLLGTIIGLTFAFNGYGVWSLIIIQIATAALMTIMLWVFEGMDLHFEFNKKSFKELYGFGVNTTFASLLNTGFDNIYQLILAKYFSLSQTGYYYQAKKLQEVPGGIINMLSQSVVFSALSKLQDDKTLFTVVYNKITLYFLVLLGFISVFIYIYAEPIIMILFGSKWLDSVIYMQLLTIASFFYYQEKINRVIFKVFNKTKHILYIEYVKKAIQTASIIIGVYFLDLKILIFGFAVTSFFGYLINYYYSKKILNNVNYYELIILLKVSFISIFTVVLCVLFCQIIDLSGYYLFLTLPFLTIIYLLGLKYLKVLDMKNEYLKIIKDFKK